MRLRVVALQGGSAEVYAFAEKITHFRWQDLDERHGTLRVWEDDDEAARLVLLTDDESGQTYVLVDQSTRNVE